MCTYPKFLLFFFSSLSPLTAQDTLRLVFTGDIMGHDAQIRSAKISKGKYDYEPCFRYIKPILQDADLAIGNLEVTLPNRKPYTGFMALPIFRSPNALAIALKNAGIDLLLTANNHSNDSNRKGICRTIETLRKLDIHQTGTFENKLERDKNYPLMIEKNGFKLAFLNFTAVGTNYIPTLRPTIVNRMDTNQIKKDLQQAKLKNPDFIIAIVHWGIEHQLTESADQIWQAEFLVRHGVNLIVGMHPHVVQPIKWVNAIAPNGDSKDGLVAFSLGNFISNHQMINADGGLLFRCELVKNNDHKTTISKHNYLPIWRYIHKSDNGKKTYMVLPIQPFDQNKSDSPLLHPTDIAAMNAFAHNICQRLLYKEGCFVQ
jgi:poly-gamma-glutamate capsule biosynthesis protein CapA/YwtB (metallophosphatase superfamily)